MQSKGDVHRSKRLAVRPCALATFAAIVLVGTFASTARADSNFERGFEDQMGRILAYEAVNLGKHVLFQGVVGPAHGYGRYPGKVYGRYDRGPGPAHDHWRRDRHPRRVVHHHVVRHRSDHRRRHHPHDRYDRHDRHHRHDRHCRHDVSYHYRYR